MTAATPRTSPRPAATAPGPLRLAVPLCLALLALLACVILRRYSIKAYSDPCNWLTYARDIQHQFWVSRWPVTYPAFLWVMLACLGPYAVFLSNLPVLLLLLAVTGGVSYLAARETETKTMAAAIGVSVVSLLVGFRPELLVYLTNPYRDSLSHLLLMGAALGLLLFLRGRRNHHGLLAFAGLCAGLAAAVREPAVLMLLPFGLTALVTVPLRPFRPLLTAALWFGIFFLVGLSPLLIQMYATTGQVLLPPQAVQKGTALPGFRFAAFGRNVALALQYYTQDGRWFWCLAAAAGLLAGHARRNRYMLTLLLPTVLMYGLLYAYYWKFVERYYFIVTVWAAPLAAYGLHQLPILFARGLRLPRWEGRGHAFVACLLAAWAATRLLALPAPGVRFRIQEAQAFTRDLNAALPAGAYVICPRNLCEIIGWFTHAHSGAATALLRYDGRSDRPVYNTYQPMLDAGRPVCFMSLSSLTARGINDDEHLVRRFFDLERTAVFSPARYHLEAITGDGELQLFRVRPWTAHIARYSLPSMKPGSIVLYDAGDLDTVAPARTFARLYLDGRTLDGKLGSGIHYYRLSEDDAARAHTLVVESDAPVSTSLPPVVLQPQAPVNMNFGVLSTHCHDSYLSASIRQEPTREKQARALRGAGAIRVPMPWPPDYLVVPRLGLRAARENGTGHVPFDVTVFDGSMVHYDLDLNRAFHPVRLPTVACASVGDQVIRLRASDPDTRVELDRLMLYPLPPERDVDIDVGSKNDFLQLSDGFHGPETHENGSSIRWTADRATIVLNLAPPAGGVIVRLVYIEGQRPPQAPAANLRISFNDYAVPPGSARTATSNGVATMQFEVSSDHVRPGVNRLVLASVPWRPRDYGSSDDRSLGIMLDHVRIACIAGDAPER